MEHVNISSAKSQSKSLESSSSHISHTSSRIWDEDVTIDNDVGGSDQSATAALAAADLTLHLQSPMLTRFPSFVPLRRRATSIASVAFLVPSSNSTCRKATVMAATFNMTATIIGGGVLSIPLSCARAGIVPFTLLMILSAVATDFSLYLLVSCSRRCGSTSYGKVTRSAFGSKFELFTSFVIVWVLLFAIVALMKLNQGIWSPIIMTGIAAIMSINKGDEGAMDDTADAAMGEGRVTTMVEDATVLLVLLGLMMPFLLKKDLTSLRHICYVGFFSIVILCAAMVYRAVESNIISIKTTISTLDGVEVATAAPRIKWMATSTVDILSALPIVLAAFLCSFNMISVSCSLINPTRERVKEVIHKAVFLSFLVMYIFGLSGYMHAYEHTRGNILLNFDPRDPIIFLGRVGCGITTLFALPMNALPCREAVLSFVAQISEAGARRGGRGVAISKEEQVRLLQSRRQLEEEHSHPNDDEDDTELGGVKNGKHDNAGTRVVMPRSYGGTSNNTSNKHQTALAQMTENANAITRKEEIIHFTTTLAIILACYIAAVLAPGVAIVWDISGSSMAFLIQFIIPAACYIKLKLRSRRDKLSWNLVLAWMLLPIAVIMSILCTVQTILRMCGLIY